LVIVAELAEESLRDRLQACRQAGLSGVPAGELLRYFREAAEALDYLHGEHILHRNVKPANLLLLLGHAKVGDLLHQYAQGVLAGTPAYRAPETWQSQVSLHSD
jgi:serine/threonine protein kinase